VISGAITDLSQLAEQFLYLGFTSNVESKFAVLVLAPAIESSVNLDCSERDRLLAVSRIFEACAAFFAGDGDVMITSDGIGNIACVLSDNVLHHESPAELARRLKKSLDNLPGCISTIACGHCVMGLWEVHRSYERAVAGLDRSIYMGTDQVIDSEDELEKAGSFGLLPRDPDLRGFEAALRDINFALASQTILGVFSGSANVSDLRGIRIFVLRFLLSTGRVAEELHVQGLDRFISADTLSTLAGLDSRDTAMDFLASQVRWFCDAASNRDKERSRVVIERVKAIVRERFKEGPTIKELAKEAYISHSYLCMLFKQETGETINDYLTRVRIERAKELLNDFSKKSYEICYEVGYNDPAYFARTFKKLTGMTPTEYRDFSSRTAEGLSP
jgi:two-component system, response regulator YesN